jgi:4'-phosphopantetheinyl transferase EntD
MADRSAPRFEPRFFILQNAAPDTGLSSMSIMEADMLLRSLLPETVLLAEMAPADADPETLPIPERDLIERAVEHRRREFAAGRIMARALLPHLDAQIDALLSDTDRVPVWPRAVVGSITHCRSLCAVAVASRTVSAGIGIDVEPARPLDPGLHAMILREAERSRVDALPSELQPLGPILVFSIKEAVYKAIYPERRQFLDFQQVEIVFTGEDGFIAEVLVPEASFPGLSHISGRYRIAEGHIASAVVLPPMSSLL